MCQLYVFSPYSSAFSRMIRGNACKPGKPSVIRPGEPQYLTYFKRTRLFHRRDAETQRRRNTRKGCSLRLRVSAVKKREELSQVNSLQDRRLITANFLDKLRQGGQSQLCLYGVGSDTNLLAKHRIHNKLKIKRDSLGGSMVLFCGGDKKLTKPLYMWQVRS